MSADEIIELLGLQPHPEGGHFRETFRDECSGGSRAASTLIYFLLRRGEHSHWHRVDSTEIWHFYAGSPLKLSIAPGDAGPIRELMLGIDLEAGQRPQGVVPSDHWQAAETLGDWTLVGCTVAPGFEFAGFTLAAPGWRPGG